MGERVTEYLGKRFRIHIDRREAIRRYVLSTLEEDGSFKPQNEPLYSAEFDKYYGFSHAWPHERLSPN